MNEDIIQNLKDVDCDTCFIEKFLKFLKQVIKIGLVCLTVTERAFWIISMYVRKNWTALII